MLFLAMIIARMAVLDPVRERVVGLSDIVLMMVAVIVHPADFVLVAHHRPVEVLERVRVSVRLGIGWQQDRKRERRQGELTREHVGLVN